MVNAFSFGSVKVVQETSVNPCAGAPAAAEGRPFSGAGAPAAADKGGPAASATAITLHLRRSDMDMRVSPL